MSVLFNRALASRFTRASFRTLTRHATSGPIDTERALRLLRNNVRDVQPGATFATQTEIANQLLQHWRNRASDARSITATE